MKVILKACNMWKVCTKTTLQGMFSMKYLNNAILGALIHRQMTNSGELLKSLQAVVMFLSCYQLVLASPFVMLHSLYKKSAVTRFCYHLVIRHIQTCSFCDCTLLVHTSWAKNMD